MGRLLNLLVILSVLWCWLHLMDPAGTVAGLVDIAHSGDFLAEGVPGDSHDEGGQDQVAHSGHHHCPVAPAQRPATSPDASLRAACLHFAPQAQALPSLAHAPPLQPPTA